MFLLEIAVMILLLNIILFTCNFLDKTFISTYFITSYLTLKPFNYGLGRYKVKIKESLSWVKDLILFTWLFNFINVTSDNIF